MQEINGSVTISLTVKRDEPDCLVGGLAAPDLPDQLSMRHEYEAQTAISRPALMAGFDPSRPNALATYCHNARYDCATFKTVDWRAQCPRSPPAPGRCKFLAPGYGLQSWLDTAQYRLS
jgi:hypothetical protein